MVSPVEYIKYRRKAKGRHGIHSPFVYDLVSKCLRIKLDNTANKAIREVRNTFANDKRTIEITDFGAGSRKLGNQRKISQIYTNCSSKGKYGRLLFQLSRHYQPKRILEFGTSLGIGTNYLFQGSPKSEITTIEACPETRKIALEQLPTSVNSIESTFQNYINQLKDECFDFVFIDGHHDGEALLHYLEALKSHAHSDTIFILDDIRWSESMHQAWKSIVSSPEYHVTIDFFRMGMVLLRPQQEKEHFILKV